MGRQENQVQRRSEKSGTPTGTQTEYLLNKSLAEKASPVKQGWWTLKYVYFSSLKSTTCSVYIYII